MKNYILLLLLLASTTSFAQRNFWAVTKGAFFYHGSQDYQTKELLNEKDQLKEHKVESREETRYNNGNKYQTIQSFDSEGRVSSITRKAKKGDYTISYKYDESDNLMNIVSSSYKGEKWLTDYSYNESNKLVERKTINNKGVYSGNKIEYNDAGKMVTHKIYKKDKELPLHEIKYTYYEDGSKKSDVYFKKGKEKYTWNYDCKPEGELIDIKNKDNSTICIKEEIDPSGNRVVWNREFNDKGVLVKTMTVYSPDSVYLEKKVFNQSDKLLSHSKQKENGGYKMVYFDKKGEVSSVYETYYNKNNELIKSERRGKWGHTFLYGYSESLKTSLVRIYKKNTYVNEYAYTFYL